MMRCPLLVLLCSGVSLTSSCQTVPSVPPASVAEPAQPIRVEASPREVRVLTGETARISATVHHAPDPRVVFHIPGGAFIAAVDSTRGVVRGLRPGSTLIVISSVADPSAQDTIRVSVEPAYRQLYGVVFDQLSRPVPDVQVELRTAAETRATRTGSDGTFEFHLEHAQSFPWWLQVTPPAGYRLPVGEENPRSIQPMRDPTHLTILLRSEEPPPAKEPTPPARDDSPVQTDSLVYTLRSRPSVYEAEAVAHYVNRTGRPVYFAQCIGREPLARHSIVPVEPRQRRPVLGVVWACAGGNPPGVVAPGDSLLVRVWLGSMESPHANPPITMADRTGCFRILLHLSHSPSEDSDALELLPEEQRRSNIFCVHPPR